MSANNFILDTRDHKFVLKEWLDVDKVLSFDAYKDYYTKEDADTFIELVYKMCKDVIAPANGECDEIGNKFVDGKVITPEASKKRTIPLLMPAWGRSLAIAKRKAVCLCI
jgi:hypothetical protein